MDAEKPAMNTDRELWREPPGDYYANSIHLTEKGGIGINVGGHVIVRTLEQWHAALNQPNERALAAPPSETPPGNEIIADLIDWVIVAFLAGWVLSGAFVFYEWFRSSRSLYK